MTKTKIVIICLIVVVAVFFVGLSLNLIDKPNQNLGNEASTEQNNQAASTYSEKSWVKVIDTILSPFASSLAVNELNLSCPHTNQGFELNAQMPGCVITVLGFSDTFKKLTLIPNNRNVKLNIAFNPEKGEKPKPFSWPSNENKDDKISFVLLGEKDLEGKTLATINVDCVNCNNQANIKIAFE